MDARLGLLEKAVPLENGLNEEAPRPLLARHRQNEERLVSSLLRGALVISMSEQPCPNYDS
jgi:hypothetical protein